MQTEQSQRVEILLGCGSRRDKRISFPGHKEWKGLVTLDMNAGHKPDFVHDISVLPLPFLDDYADEIHAYEVMEHVGQQGDWHFFFAQWSDLWRILKPDGFFFGTSPHWSSPWAWMDPGHTRAFGPEMMTFLSQDEYKKQIGRTPMTDYRFCYRADFNIVHSQITADRQFCYVLQAVKPSRVENGKDS